MEVWVCDLVLGIFLDMGGYGFRATVRQKAKSPKWFNNQLMAFWAERTGFSQIGVLFAVGIKL